MKDKNFMESIIREVDEDDDKNFMPNLDNYNKVTLTDQNLLTDSEKDKEEIKEEIKDEHIRLNTNHSNNQNSHNSNTLNVNLLEHKMLSNVATINSTTHKNSIISPKNDENVFSHKLLTIDDAQKKNHQEKHEKSSKILRAKKKLVVKLLPTENKLSQAEV